MLPSSRAAHFECKLTFKYSRSYSNYLDSVKQHEYTPRATALGILHALCTHQQHTSLEAMCRSLALRARVNALQYFCWSNK